MGGTEGDEDEQLRRFLDQQDPEEFWQQVEANLRAGRIRMLFVADKIGRELRRIIEFLNEQMRPAEILAVEISQFKNSNGVRTLVPRLVGATERALSVKSATGAPPPRTNDEWLAEYTAANGDQIGAVARKLADLLRGASLTMSLTPSQNSAVFKLAVQGHPPRSVFYLNLRPAAGLAIWVKALAGYAPFKTDESRADVVKDVKALGLRFVTDPPKPEISIPTVPLETLTAEGVFAKFSDYLFALIKRAKS